MSSAFTFATSIPTPDAGFIGRCSAFRPDFAYRRSAIPSGLSPALNSCHATTLGDAQVVESPTDNESLTPPELRELAEAGPLWRCYVSVTSFLTNMFPLWVLLVSMYSYHNPASLAWFDNRFFTLGLGILMLSMGITLTVDDFLDVAKMPGAVALGFVGCYGLMPLIGLVLAQILSSIYPSFTPALGLGLVLIGSCPGGQASNLATHIARANVALSVLMTAVSTVGAIFMTPLLSKVLMHTVINIDAWGMARSTFEVVLLPTALGVALNHFAPRFVKLLLPFSPVVGVVATALLCGSAVAQSAEAIGSAGLVGALVVPTFLLHFLGHVLGYLVPRWLGYKEDLCRTLSIETGMKSTALGFLLAVKHFGDPQVAIPSAVSVTVMAVTGSTIAVLWRQRDAAAAAKKEKSQ
eukprot:Rmarinus@m.7623